MRITERVSLTLVLTSAFFTMKVCTAVGAPAFEPKVNRIERPVAPSAVERVGGFIGTRLKLNIDNYLHRFDIDSHVRMFEDKKHRDWWWIGEQPGKWLETAVLAAEQSGDKELREKAEKVLTRLVAAQEPGGYLGITDPAVRTEQLPLRGMDAYELYFMLHGLLTTHELWNQEDALQAARRLGDYFVDKIGPGKAEFWPRPKGQTIAGHNIHYSLEGTLLANPMLRLYMATGDEKYLKWSQWVIDNIDLWSGHNTFSKLDKVADGTLGVHQLQPRVHSHTFHMNLLAFLRLYQITGDESLLNKVRGAWRDIAGRQIYLTGSVSVAEYYKAGYNLPITGEMAETCAMMSWIEVNQYLLELTADPVYADAIERLLWNHLFAAQTIDGDIFRYHTPLNATKPAGYFHGPDCCTASGPRIAAKIPLLIYAVGKDGLYINQFIDSTAKIKLDSGNIVSLAQQTDYPCDSKIEFIIEPQKAESFTLYIRLPSWCQKPSLSVNGQAVNDLKSGTYANLNREWKKGDRVTLSLPMMPKWVKRKHTTEDMWTLTRGPVVYAVDTVLWDESALEMLGAVPENLSEAIKLVVDESGQCADLKPAVAPAGALGPAYCVTVVFPSGKKAEVTALPFANIGRWYANAAHKPDRDEHSYAYAVWLGSADNIPAFSGAESAGASLLTAYNNENIRTEIIVAADGSGQFRTVQAAVDSVPEGNKSSVIISIKPGTYEECIVVPPGKRFIRFVGQDAEKTILTYDLYAGILGDDGKPIGTFRTPSTTIHADDFTAENITFENTAGAVGQALAITISGDRAVFRNCRFLGWQDTVLSQWGRHYFENCYISGRCDFIFGGATAFFESCHIHCLSGGYITAAATPKDQPYGYVFSNCKITREAPEVTTFLGRPWRGYASVIFLNTEMSEVVRPVGWNNWRHPEREKTSRYAEFNSTGPGANPKERAPWSRQLTEAEAKAITVEKVLGGVDGWNPKTGEIHSAISVAPVSSEELASINVRKTDISDEGFVYLFSSFRGNGQDGLRLSYSFDGYNWTDLGGSFIKPNVGKRKLMRDPSIVQGPDGMFHMVWTTGWFEDKGFGYARSKDLIHWSEQKFIEAMAHEPTTQNVWAPELFYDEDAGHFIICWASTILPNRYPNYLEPLDNNHRMYYTTTRDFETFTETKLFCEPGFSIIDGTIVKRGDKNYVLVHKDNTRPIRSLRVSFADNPLGPWSHASDSITEKFTEGPTALKLSEEWIIYFDMYRKNRYGAVKTKDFRTWIDITGIVSFPQGHKHGTLFKAPYSVFEGLKKYCGLD